MSTHTHAPRACTTAPTQRLRRLVAIGALAPLLAVSACSGDDPITAQTPAAASTGAPDTGSTASESTEATAAPTATTTPIKAVITDPEMGHIVTATKLVRNVPWPEGNPVGEASFEIVAVEVTWKAGTRYSADLRPWMLTLSTSKTPYAVTTTEFGALQGNPLVAVARTMERSGWVYFKVDRGSGSKVSLSLQRPEYKVSTTGKTLPRKTFTANLAS